MNRKRQTIEKEIRKTIEPFQAEIDYASQSLADNGIGRERLITAILHGSGDPLENDERITRLRELRTQAFEAIGKKMVEFQKQGLLDNLPDIADETATRKENFLAGRIRGMKVNIPDILVTGFGIWLFPMHPGEVMPRHDHNVNVGSIVANGRIAETFYHQPDPELNQLEILMRKVRGPGDLSLLDPAKPNIHSFTDLSPDEQKGADVFHIVGFSPENGLFHPVRSVYNGDGAPPGAVNKIGLWDVVERAGDRITVIEHLHNGYPTCGMGML